MKKWAFILMVTVFLVQPLVAKTVANILSRNNLLLTIDKGSQHGLRSGMKGILKTLVRDSGGGYEVNMGIVVVRKVMEGSAEVYVTNMGVGFTAAEAQIVEFEVAAEGTKPEIQTTQTTHASKMPEPYKNKWGFQEAIFFNNTVMIEIPAGEFTVGSPKGEGNADEHPAHKVFIDSFWLSQFEVTFNQYDQFCRDAGRPLPKDNGWMRGNMPVVNVSWEDAMEYCRWLSRKTGLNFRLPTEAEWEKAAFSRYPWGNVTPDAKKGNFKGDQDGYVYTAPVGSFPRGASIYGVMDLAGNVWEWILDWYDPNYYRVSSQKNPKGPAQGKTRSVRGGSWFNGPELVRSANRSDENPSSRRDIIGFRVALEVEK